MATRRAVLTALIVLASACSRPDSEKELRATVAAMAAAIESRSAADFSGHIADDFTRDSGGFDKQEARRLVAATMLRNERIHVNAVVSDVRIEGTRAIAKVRVIATGGAGLLPERGQTWDFDTVWRLEGGRWKVFNAEWREGL